MISLHAQPVLRIHDEFSYLLAADTLLHGRLTNPTPPAADALQSFHIITQPTYASKYPIGIGIITAIGWILFGTPLGGSWLGAALLASSATWMLAGTLPRRWSLFGGLIVSLHPFVQLAWSQSLLHGFLPAIGCAMLTGGALRLRRRVQFGGALACGIGVGVLAISRPFEGLCCTSICTSCLMFSWRRWPLTIQLSMALRACGYAATPVALALALIVAHNMAVTGHLSQMPYQLHEQQYAVAPVFVFESPKLENTKLRGDLPSVFHAYHAIDCLNWHLGRVGFAGWQRGFYDSVSVLFLLAFPFGGLILISGQAWLRYRVAIACCVAIGLQIAASSCVTWVYAHYLAPLLPWLLLLSLLALRVSFRKRHRQRLAFARLAATSIVFIQVAVLLVFASFASEKQGQQWAVHRQRIVNELTSNGTKHLILVHYAADHNVNHEWVYNDSDPLTSPIVWARHEDGRWLREILTHYAADREVWEIYADEPNSELKPYRNLP